MELPGAGQRLWWEPWVGLGRPVTACWCTSGRDTMMGYTQPFSSETCIPAVFALKALNHRAVESISVMDCPGAKSHVALWALSTERQINF